MWQLLSSPEEHGLASVKPKTSFHFQKQNELGQDSTVPEASRLPADPSCFLHRFMVFLLGRLGPLWGTGFGGEGKSRISLVGGREKDGEDEDLRRIQSMSVQVVYKVWRTCFLPLPPTARAVMQQNSFLSNHYRRFLEVGNGKPSACNGINCCFLNNYSLWCCMQWF